MEPSSRLSRLHRELLDDRAGVPAELHVYATGGHGFGLRPSADACSTWPKRCEEWLRGMKLIGKAGAGE